MARFSCVAQNVISKEKKVMAFLVVSLAISASAIPLSWVTAFNPLRISAGVD
jgi:hypothetical protein